MRGSPLLRFVLLSILLVAAGIPVWQLTRTGGTDAPAPDPRSAPEETQTLVLLTFVSTAPAAVNVEYAGKTLWQLSDPAADAETTITLPLQRPADLVIRAHWTASGRQALRLTAARDGDVLTETTLWGEQSLEDVVTIAPPSAP